jgi:hypothetical protein
MHSSSSSAIATTLTTKTTTITIPTTNASFYIMFSIVVIIHLALTILHTPMVLPRIGVHTAAYVGILVGLGCFFAGLGMWDALG